MAVTGLTQLGQMARTVASSAARVVTRGGEELSDMPPAAKEDFRNKVAEVFRNETHFAVVDTGVFRRQA